MDKAILRKLQGMELVILKEIKRVCIQNKIEYSLCGGTLLGAIRHKGFIPWDDDIDIYMTWDNFMRFEEIANSQLQDDFFFQTPKTDPECKSYFCGRVRLRGTYFESNSLPNHWKHNGIFVDVLPVVKVPLSRAKQMVHFYFFQVIIRILWLRNGYTPHPSNFVFRSIMRLSFLLSSFVPTKCLEGAVSNYQKKYEGLLDFDYMDLLAGNYKGAVIPKEMFCSYRTHVFEDDDFSIFSAAEQYLSQYYGNWMELPPENERHPHHCIKIDFGKYHQEK